jgi:ribosome-binding protein aMBF1 (putative translation factor)
MKVCEICGSVDEVEEQEMEVSSSKILHICEDCRKDRISSID